MYQCKSFYSMKPSQKESQNMVAAAWSVTADSFYSYSMKDDILAKKDMYCFIRTVEGIGRIETDAGKIHLPAGTYVILPRRSIQKYGSNSEIWSYYWVDFMYDKKILSAGKVTAADYCKKEKELFEELLSVGIKYPYEFHYINGVFAHYYYHLALNKTQQKKPQSDSPRFSEICSYIGQKLYSPITIQDIADFFEVSPRRIHQIFMENCSMPPKKYISSLKIEKAKNYLAETSTPVLDIAAILGYNNAYHFSAAFKKIVGCSPRVYRANQADK